MLIVKNLIKDFKGIKAVNDLSFSIEKGEIFGLLGPNGAGKTTTIRTVLNIIKPNSGLIEYNGKQIDNNFFNNIGYLPEERGLYKKNKIIDVILFFAKMKGMQTSDAKSQAKEWLAKFNIVNYYDKNIETLSKGNQQKIQFIISVIHNPSLIILDEPFSGFDPINQQIIKEEILSFAELGKIIILSTHQMETAEKLCSNILLINNGKEVLNGKLIDIKKKFGSNCINIDYSGDSSFLNLLPGISHIENYKNSAQLQLKEGINPAELLRQIVQKLDVKYFSVVEPSLNKIFIDLIKQNSE